MKTTIVFSAIGLLFAVLWIAIFNLEPPAESAPSIAVEPTSPPQTATQADTRFDTLSQQLQSWQDSNQQQLREAAREQGRLRELLQQLEVRLTQVEDLASANALGPVEEVDEVEQQRPPQLSDGQVGAWMDNSLSSGLRDEVTSGTMADQVLNSLDRVPGVLLDEVSCGNRFCRATFSHVSGQQPDIGDLFGVAPFENEGFTVIQPDGRVRLYFNQPGQSLAEVREEVGDGLGY